MPQREDTVAVAAQQFVQADAASRRGLTQVLGVMEPLLPQAYKTLLELEARLGARLSNREAVLEEIQDHGASYRIDVASFNGLVQELALSIPELAPEEALARLVRIRLLSLALEEEFRNLSDSIEKAVSELSRHVA